MSISVDWATLRLQLHTSEVQLHFMFASTSEVLVTNCEVFTRALTRLSLICSPKQGKGLMGDKAVF